MVNKKIILPLIAALTLIMAVAGVFAMRKVTYYYYQYNGSSNTSSQIQNSANWTSLGTSEPALDCNEPSGTICYIKSTVAPGSGFSTYISTQTESSLTSSVQAYRSN